MPILQKIVIGSGITKIGNHAFRECNVTEVIFERNESGESSVKEIGISAFRDCFSLTEIEIPANVETIGDTVFRNGNKLATIEFEEGSNLTTIGKKPFTVQEF